MTAGGMKPGEPGRPQRPSSQTAAVTTTRPDAGAAPVRPGLVVLLTVVLTFVVLVFVLPNLWYGVHDISDIPVYQAYADQAGSGLTPYLDFEIEYPPLAVPFFRLPGARLPLETYMRRFSLAMGAVTLLGGAAVALTACALWRHGRRAYAAGALYALGVALTGAIIVNRYDAVVALVVAVFLLCLVRNWHTAAAATLGLGFALKITPVALLPLVLLLAGPARRWLRAVLGFCVAAFAGFMPYLVTAPRGIWHVFQYHLERPLQIESALGAPLLLGHALGLTAAQVGHSHGSHHLVAVGADLAADLAGVLTFGSLVIVYAVLLARRPRLGEAPGELPLAALALLLALMAFGKVLSPQYFIWILPALALAAVREPLLGALGGVVLALTHLEFPALYWHLVDLRTPVVSLVTVRNVLLLALFAAVALRIATSATQRPPRHDAPFRRDPTPDGIIPVTSAPRTGSRSRRRIRRRWETR